MHWHQKSRQDWWKLGEINTKYFHTLVIKRRHRANISQIKDLNGTTHQQREDIGNCFVNYFSDLFSSTVDDLPGSYFDVIPQLVSDEDNECLLRPVQDSEVFEALNHMGSLKAPYRMVFSNRFFKIIGMRMGLLVAKKLELDHIIIEVDSSFLHKAIIGEKEESPSSVIALIEDIKQLLKGFRHTRMVWNYREANCVADTFARHASTQAASADWMTNPIPHQDNIPEVIQPLLNEFSSFWWSHPPAFVLSSIRADVQGLCTERLINSCFGQNGDGLLWDMDLKRHASGDYSIAVVQANSSLEDQSQVFTSPNVTYVGVYDGHGGPEASRFINDHLFHHLHKMAIEQGGVSVDVIKKAFDATEQEFVKLVKNSWTAHPQIASVGSCCLVGAIAGDTLYVANLGDSRAVLGRRVSGGKRSPVVAERLSTDHNVAVEEVRKEVEALHPDDAHVVVYTRGVWRIKGIKINRRCLSEETRVPQRSSFPAVWISSSFEASCDDSRTLCQDKKINAARLVFDICIRWPLGATECDAAVDIVFKTQELV
ncbi:hypothetical protein IFM89_026588 [Coptis chinensis]|uniref:protein-serine/threonine phosphatase n=1 Tax=Coptis chinensis TaxID=261450 RepID=A0A835IMH8_9MAGN|nr:hypothetical protein IFM89_026588 [Coptis chinensis]